MDEKSKADPHNVREMKIPEDLDRVKEIWLNGAKEAHKEFINIDFWESIDIENEINIAKERYVYLDDEKEIRGFIIARSDGYIFEIYTEKDSQNKGIGTALFETLQGVNPKFPELKGQYSQFTSHVYAHNYISIAWHIKNKFKITGMHFCPKSGLPKFIMIWNK